MIQLSNWLKTSAVGLDIGSEWVRAVELVRVFNRITVRKYGKERIESHPSSDEAKMQAIHRLMQRLNIRQKEINVHLGGNKVRHVALECPLIPVSELREWIHNQIAKKLPAQIDTSNLIISFHISKKHEKGFTIMAAYCQRHIVEQIIALLKKVGLTPAMMGAGSLDVYLAYVFETMDMLQKTVRFVDMDSKIINVLTFEEGSPVSCETLDDDVESNQPIHDFIPDFLRDGEGDTDAAIFVGKGAEEQIVSQCKQDGIHARLGIPLRGIMKGEELTTEYSLAAGLALKRFFPLMNTVDMLPEHNRVDVTRQRAKKKALSFILGFGAVILVSLMAINTLKVFLTNQLENQEEQMFVLNEQIFVIENIKREQGKLEQALLDMRALVTKRSCHARLMERLGSALPKGVWLREFSIGGNRVLKRNNKKTTDSSASISGWALEEVRIADFLSHLEGFADFEEVRLMSTNRVSSEEVWKRSRLKKIPLIEFTISASMKDG